MSPVHVQFPKMMECMLQIINLDNVQVFYTHPGEGASWSWDLQQYVIKFVSYLRQVDGFLRVLRLPQYN
jgi:hypothetical protein